MSQFALVCINIIFAALAAAVASYFGARAKKVVRLALYPKG
ncbi:hypothetical protein AB6D33_23335 [Vibrio splendidus]|jgi:hypothetical protein